MRCARKIESRRGFALLELIIYLGLLGFVLSSVILFTVEFVGVQAKSVALAESARNTKFAVSRVAYEVRSADGIDYDNSVFDAHPATLTLETSNPATNPTVVSVSGGQLIMSQGAGAAIALTPSTVEVQNFIISNVADVTHSRSVRVHLTLGSASTGSLEEFSGETNYETTVRVWKDDGFNTGGTPPPSPTLTQSAYRLFANHDSTDVGASLSAQDTPATLAADDDSFRLRLMLDVDIADLAASGATLKLQFAEKSGICDTGFSGETYADVTDATNIAYADNSPADGAALTVNADDPTRLGRTTVAQTYEEANNFSNPNAIDNGETGLWDFALIDNDGTASADYCFRVVFSDNSSLDTYSVVPEVTTAASGTQSAFRVIEYHVSPGLTGTSFSVSLAQDLESNYFAIVRGSDGNGNSTRGPDENYVSLTADPFGTGDLSATGTTDTLEFTRHNNADGWIGVLTVVECLGDCDVSGFQLLDVTRTSHSGSSVSGTDSSGIAWSDINQVMLLGGYNGSGCDTSTTSSANHKSCHVRIWPSSSGTINWSRHNGGVTTQSATSTVMVLEWGSDWNVRRVRVTGNNGGNGANSAEDYDTGAISSVTRGNTWVWGTGHTTDNGIGDAAEGVLVTLGNGVSQNATESTVAIGCEYTDNKDFEVYALEHSGLAVDYRFKTDGDSNRLTVDVITDSASIGGRMALVTSGLNGTNNVYPRPIFSARYLSDTFIRLERRYSGQNFPAWVQGVDFSGVTY